MSALESKQSQIRFQSVQDALTQKLVKAELTPDEYKEKIRAYQNHFLGEPERDAGETGEVSTETDPVFATGGPNPRLNALAIFKKACLLSLMIAIPFAVYRVVGTQSLQDMRPFLLWVAEMVAFFSLLGLWAGDLRLLLESGFKFHALRRVHNLPFLSAYASTLLTAVATSLIAFLSGQMTDFFKFFLQIFMKQGSG